MSIEAAQIVHLGATVPVETINMRLSEALAGGELTERLEREYPTVSSSEWRSSLIISPRTAGVDHATVEIIVAFAPIANEIAISAWRYVILPWLRRQLGDDVLGPEELDGDED